MSLRLLVLPLLIALIFAAVFGLYIPTMSHAGHQAGCPFAPGGTAMCSSPLAHLEHWQSAFAMLLVELFVFFAFVAIFFSIYALFDPDVGLGSLYQLQRRLSPIRPSLFQELFSAGILNRRAP